MDKIPTRQMPNATQAKKQPEYGSQDFYKGMAMIGNIMFLLGVMIFVCICLIAVL